MGIYFYLLTIYAAFNKVRDEIAHFRPIEWVLCETQYIVATWIFCKGWVMVGLYNGVCKIGVKIWDYDVMIMMIGFLLGLNTNDTDNDVMQITVSSDILKVNWSSAFISSHLELRANWSPPLQNFVEFEDEEQHWLKCWLLYGDS